MAPFISPLCLLTGRGHAVACHVVRNQRISTIAQRADIFLEREGGVADVATGDSALILLTVNDDSFHRNGKYHSQKIINYVQG